jgi:manganese/zinc/iron transport system permease protein
MLALLTCLQCASNVSPVEAAPADDHSKAHTERGAGSSGRVETAHRSLADLRIKWPDREQFMRVVMLRDYNTRVVLGGTVMLGAAAGIVGVFMLLRRRSLLGDVISHSSLPGIGVAFITMEAWSPGSGKSLPGLLVGAVIAGMLGVFCTKLILRYSRVKEDAAMAIVLSIFFGFGVALFTIIQNIPTGNSAGLNHFIFGKAASMVAQDVYLIGTVAVIIVVIVAAISKEFRLLSFDHRFASTQGFPVFWLDILLMYLATGVTVIGLQSVGLLLVVAMLIIPAAASRFWTDSLGHMTYISAGIGAASAALGVFASALFPRLAAGAVIVLTGSALFTVSMFFGIRRGILIRLWTQYRLRLRVGRQHILRACYELLEDRIHQDPNTNNQLTDHLLTVPDLLPLRSWNPRRLTRLLARAERHELLVRVRDGAYRMTRNGADAAEQVVRNHRLWEMFLIEYADIAPSHVDRDADDIEHLLGSEIVRELEQLLSKQYPNFTVPPSPHRIESSTV